MKRQIRLTESDLHRIVKESVNKVLNEVRVRCTDGEIHDLHGWNPDDWSEMAEVRYNKSDYYSDMSDMADAIGRSPLPKKLQDISRRHYINGNQNYNNYRELEKRPLPYDDQAKHRNADGTRKW